MILPLEGYCWGYSDKRGNYKRGDDKRGDDKRGYRVYRVSFFFFIIIIRDEGLKELISA